MTGVQVDSIRDGYMKQDCNWGRFAFSCDIGIGGDWTRAGGECYCYPHSYTTCDPAFAVTPVTKSLLAGSHNNWSVGELEVFALEASG